MLSWEYFPEQLNRGSRLFEARKCGFFVFVDFEDGQEFGDHEQVFDLLCELQELELASLVLGGGISRNELADAGTVNVGYTFKIEDYFLPACRKQATYGIAQLYTSLPDCNSALKVKHDDVAHIPFLNF